LEEDKAEMDYDIPLDLPGAYKALKGILSKPVIVHSKRPKANYMKPTFSTSWHAVAGKVGEERFLEYSQITHRGGPQKSKDEFTLPPINEHERQSKQNLSIKEKKEKKIDDKIGILIQAQWDEERAEEEQKKGLREEYGFSDSDVDQE
jgi:hypothetical protein